MRPILLLFLAAALALITASCDGTPPSSIPTTTAIPTSAAPVTSSAASTAPTSPPPPSPEVPVGVPPVFEDDVAAANVPAAALVPLKTEVTGTWYGVTSVGEAIVVAWQEPGRDPLRLDRGFAVWRRFDDAGAPWRPVAGESIPRSRGVLGITGTPAELTGDGSDDVMLHLDTGGSGGCERTLVLDLAAGEAVYDEEGCDRRIEPHAGPTGLLVTEAVYEPGDPHCCPSAFRETVLTYAGDGAWDIASERTVTP
jgi:hypothetical protein